MRGGSLDSRPVGNGIRESAGLVFDEMVERNVRVELAAVGQEGQIRQCHALHRARVAPIHATNIRRTSAPELDRAPRYLRVYTAWK